MVLTIAADGSATIALTAGEMKIIGVYHGDAGVACKTVLGNMIAQGGAAVYQKATTAARAQMDAAVDAAVASIPRPAPPVSEDTPKDPQR